jgi:signal peptidase II
VNNRGAVLAETSDKCCSQNCILLNRQLSIFAAHLLFWPVFIIGLVADLLTKSYIFRWLNSRPLPRYVVLDGFFQIVLVENRGAAWGIAADRTILLIVISVIALVVVFAIFLFMRGQCPLVVFSLGLFAAGICGNLYDRLFNAGKVRDFLDFYYKDWHFPAFNIADSMLTVAVFLLILITLFSSKPITDNR